jgi:hypothetical protein
MAGSAPLLQNIDGSWNRRDIQELLTLMHDPVQLLFFVYRELASLADIEISELLKGKSFPEISFENR